MANNRTVADSRAWRIDVLDILIQDTVAEIERLQDKLYELKEERDRHVKAQKELKESDTRCIYERAGGIARCNGGGYDGCACGPYDASKSLPDLIIEEVEGK